MVWQAPNVGILKMVKHYFRNIKCIERREGYTSWQCTFLLPGSQKKIHKLDKEREQYMNNTEKKCRKRRIGGVDLYPEVIV